MTVDSEDRWTIRGVPLDVRQRSSAAAKARGISVGAWLVEIVEAALAAQSDKPIPTDTTSPLADRVTMLEAQMEAMAAKPSPPSKRAKRTKLTPELTVEARKLQAEGLTQRAIGKQLGISFGAVNKLLKAAARSSTATDEPED
jgi:predicted DNA-binding protein (UPF0251 family)